VRNEPETASSLGGGVARCGRVYQVNMLLAMPNAIYMEEGGAHKRVNGEMLAPEAPGMSSGPKG
jgi:hypothetical protein